MHRHGKQRGAALVLAIFSLLLISAIGLGLLFSSDTETSISINYRDKQVATYAALSGLQEARDRIQPLTGDLGCGAAQAPCPGLNIVPAALPSLTGSNVLYIINPAPGETVAPWDPTNKYFDTELCHENILGLSGTSGVPCSAGQIPSGNSWYLCYDNSGTNSSCRASSAGWQLLDASNNPIPVSYKWARVTLKADNMTPVTVGSGNGSQVCWTGLHEQQIPVGYTTTCTPLPNKVTNISITNQGSGYTSSPTVVISSPDQAGGTQATATAQVTQPTGGVTSVSLTSGGQGYTTPPRVYVTPTDGLGSGALVVAEMGSPVQSVSLTTNGTPPCYPANANLQPAFDPTYGSGAAGSVAMSAGAACIYSFAATGSCSDNGVSSITVTGANGSGSGFTGTVTFDNNNKVRGYAQGNPGNYTAVPSTFSTGTCSNTSTDAHGKLTISPVYGYQVQSVTVTSGGLYTNPPAVTIIGAPAAVGSGTISGASTLSGPSSSSVSGLTIQASGSGYDQNPTLTFDPPPAGTGNSSATGLASISSTGVVSGVTVTNPGSGYTHAPTVTIGAPGSGVTATAIANLGSGGAPFGAAYLLTALGQTASGTRVMAQMEAGATYTNYSLHLGGSLTLAGPSPAFGTPSSGGFQMNGNDCPSCAPAPSTCNSATSPPKPAIGVYDDPNNPTSPTAVSDVINALAKPNNYIGLNSSPDVENTFNTLGGPLTPQDLIAFQQSVAAVATNTYTSDPGASLAVGTPTNPVIDYVNSNLTLGSQTGYGILLVTGTLYISGDYHWNGVVLLIGAGASVMSGGGNGQINGAVFAANTGGGSPAGTALGSPNLNWGGGGGNGIQYDHCWADDMLARVPWASTPSQNPLQVISLRMLNY